MRTMMKILVLLALPAAASAQLGRMLGDAAGTLDDAAKTAERAAGKVEQAGEVGSAVEEAAAGGAAPAVPAAESSGLVALLVRQLGVTPEQATGGAGAVFASARGQMAPESFASVASAVPGMDGLLAAAPEAGAGAATSRGAAALGALAGQGGSVGAAAQLAGSFSSLGMGAGMVAQFVPVCVDYVRQQAGPETAALLQAALP